MSIFKDNSDELKVIFLDVNKVYQNPYQPRRIFNHRAMESLMNSIKKYGVIVPIIVRRTSRGEYELACGERRLRSCKELGIAKVPAIVKNLSTPEMIELVLTENLMRKDLVLIEEAEAFDKLVLELGQNENDISERLGIPAEMIAKYRRVVSLPIILKKAIYSELITEEHALLLENEKDEGKLLQLISRIVNEKLSLQQLASLTN
jgi:ParB family chromosome partitioning protein